MSPKFIFTILEHSFFCLLIYFELVKNLIVKFLELLIYPKKFDQFVNKFCLVLF